MKKLAAHKFPKDTLFISNIVYHPVNDFETAKNSYKNICFRSPTVLGRWHLLMQYIYFLQGWFIEQSFNIAKKGGHYELDAYDPQKARAVEFIHSLRGSDRVIAKQKALNNFLSIYYVLDPKAFLNNNGDLAPETLKTLKSLLKEGAESIEFVDMQTNICLTKEMIWKKKPRPLHIKKIFEKADATIIAKYYVSYPLDKIAWEK